MDRRRAHLILGGLLAFSTGLLVVSCSDDSAGPGRVRQAQFAIVPTFANAAAGIVPLAEARFVVTRTSDDAVVRDTVIDLAAEQDSIDLALTVPFIDPSETFLVEITLLLANGDVAFRGGPVEVSPNTTGSPTPVDIIFDYEGPGADATSVEISEPVPALLEGESVELTATVFGTDTTFPGTPLGWESLDSATAFVTGIDPTTYSATILAGSVRGTARIVVTSPTDLTDTVLVAVQPAPSSIVAESGDGQTATVGTTLPLPLTARVTASDGQGVSGLQVDFVVTSGAGTLSVASAVTDVNGRASTNWTLGLTAGAQTVTATTAALTGSTAPFTADAIPGVPENIVLSAGNGQSATVGSPVTIAPAVLVTDANGNPVPGIDVTFEVVLGGGAVAGIPPRTNATGVATIATWVLGTAPGVNTLRAFLPAFAVLPVARDSGAAIRAAPSDTALFTATATPGAPAALVIVLGDAQTGQVGTLLAESLVVRVEDALANTLAGVQVDWSVTLGNGSVSLAAVTTDAAGLAAVAWTLGTVAGTGHSVTASASGVISAAVYTATALPGPASALAYVVQPSTVLEGGVIAPAVEVEILDALGNRVTSDNTTGVGIAITGGTGTVGAVLSGTTTQIAVAGLVTFADLGIDLGGTGYTLDATIPSLALVTSAPFAVTTFTATLVSHWSGNGDATDSADGNNGVLLGGIGFAPGLASQAFSLDGIDDFVNVGNAPNLQLSSGLFSVSAWVLPNVAGVDQSLVDKMTGVNEDGWRLVRQSSDQFWFCLGGGPGVNGCAGGAATTVQTTSISPGLWYHVAAVKTGDSIAIYLNGVLEQQKPLPAFIDNQTNDLLIGTSAAVPINGFTNGRIDDVRIYAGALTAVQIDSIFDAVVAAAPSNLTFSVEPVGTAANATLATVEVTALDPLGNVDAGFTGTVSIAIGNDPSGTAVLGGTTAALATAGVAQFTDLTIDQPGTGYTLVTTATGFNPATSTAFNITSAAPPGTDAVWSGTTSTDWLTATNWSSGAVPDATTDVFIPAAAVTQPTLSGAGVVDTITVEAGATLTLGAGGQLTAAGSVDAGNTIAGPGMLTMNGLGMNLRGTVSNVTIAGDVTLNGTVTADLAAVTGSLTLGGNRLNATLFVVTAGTGLLIMTDPADVLDVVDAEFAGAPMEDIVTDGVILVSGGLRQTTELGGATDALQPDNLVVFDGTGPQTVEFDTPGAFQSNLRSVEVTGTGPITNGGVGSVVILDALTDIGGGWQVAQTEFPGPFLSVTGATGGGSYLFSGSVTLGSSPVLTGNVDVTGQLTLGDNSLGVVNGTFSTLGTGTLVMNQPADRLTVTDIVFDGGSEAGLLTAGEISVGGNFTQVATTSTSSFSAASGHRVVFGGTGTQTLTMATPATAPFGEIELAKSAGVLDIGGANLSANGQLLVQVGATQTFLGNGSAAVSVSGLSVDGLVLDGVQLTSTGGTINPLDNVTFQNMSPAATQLTINHPGAVTPFTVTGLQFLTVPTTGSYIDATDLTPGPDPNIFTINLVGSVPLDGSAFTTVAGGAVVNWPGGAATWIGGDVGGPTNWQIPANWSTSAVPTLSNDVLIPAAAINQPTLTIDGFANNLTVESGATINTGGFGLAAAGNVDAGTTISGTGLLLMTGTGATLQGTVPNVSIIGDVSLSGTTNVSGSLSIQGNLTIAGQTLGVTGDLLTTTSGTLTMQNALDLANVAGNVSFVGGSTTGLLTNGLLSVGLDFVQISTNSTSSFAASGAHVTEMADLGLVGANISFDSPSATESHFGNLDLTPDSDFGVTLDARAHVLGDVFLTDVNANCTGLFGTGHLIVDGNIDLQATSCADVSVDTVSIAGLITSDGGDFDPDVTVFTGIGQTIPIDAFDISYRKVIVSGSATFGGSDTLSIRGGFFPADAGLTVTGSLDLGGNTIGVEGDFSTTGTGVLNMTAPTAVLDVDGNVSFGGGSTAGLMIDGVLNVAGTFSQSGDVESFHPGGVHTTVFGGTAPQTITFANPGIGVGNPVSHFANVAFNGTGAVTLASDAFAHSNLISAGQTAATIIGGGNTLAVGGLDADNLTFDRVLLEWNGTATFPSFGTFVVFDNVTFQNYLTTDTQFTVVHPGASTPFTFNGTVFNTTPTSGFYIAAIDNLLDANVLTINMVASTPADGSAFESETLATVNWLGGGQAPIARWLTGASGLWSDAANWDTPTAPGPGDSAVIDVGGTYIVTINAATTVGFVNLGGTIGTQTLSVTTGALTIDNGAVVGTNGVLALANTLTGAGNVTIDGTLNWTSGTMSGTGITRINAGATAAITGTAGKTLDSRRFENAGTMTLNGTGDFRLGGTPTAVFDNQAGATFELQTASGDVLFTGSGTATFQNAGTYTKTPPGQNIHQVEFVNLATGTLAVVDGTFQLTAGNDTLGGAVSLGTGSVIELRTPTFLPNGFLPTGAGRVRLPIGITVTLGVLGTDVVTIPRLDLSAGTLTGPATLIVPDFQWTGGTLSGSGVTQIPLTGVAALTGASGKTITSRRFENAGSVTLSGTGDLRLGGTPTAVFDNQPGATFELQTAGGDVLFTGSGTATFQNAGTYIKTPAGQNVQDIEFVNLTSGTLQIVDGIFQLTSGNDTLAGAVSLGAGSVIELRTPTFLPNGFLPTGAGRVSLPVGTTVTMGVLGTDVVTIPRLDLSSGTLTGPATLIVTDSLQWTGGTMSGTGITQIPVTALALLTGTGSKTLSSRRFENAGATTLNGTGDFRLGGTPTAVFDNQVGASFELQTAGGDVLFSGSGTATFQNAGTYVKTPAGQNVQDIEFVNLASGTLQIVDGIFQLSAGNDTLLGAVSLGAGSVLELRTPTFLPNGFLPTGAGRVRLPIGITVTLGVLGTDVVTIPRLDLSSGTLTGPATLIVSDSLQWTGGTMSGSGITQIPVGALALLTGTGSQTLASRRFENAGTVELSGTGDFRLGGTPTAVFDNQAGASFELQTAGGDVLFTGSGTATFQNVGLFLKTPIGLNAIGIDFTNTGTVDLQGGTLDLNAAFTHTSGSLQGTATLDLASATGVDLSGPVNPGTSPGVLSITGNYAPSGAGVLNAELGGLIPGSGFDQLVVSGTPTLAGTLNIILFGGFLPSLNDQFLIVSSTATTGSFATVTGLSQSGITMDTATTGAGLVVTVTASPVPPGTDIVWEGGVSTDWSTAGNWNTGVVPTLADNVFVPAAAVNQPTVSVNSSVQNLVVQDGATVTLGSLVVLTATGNVTTGTTVTGPVGSGVTMTGTGVTVRGSMPSLLVTGTATSNGALTLAGDLIVQGVGATLTLGGTATVPGDVTVSGTNANLNLGGQTLAVAGDVFTQSAGAITMDNAADLLDIEGDVFINGGATGSLTSGVMRIAGDFTQTGSTQNFFPSGNHLTAFDGTLAQAISLQFGQSFGFSRFHNVEFDNVAGVTLITGVQANGNATVTLGSAVTGGGNTLRVAGNVTAPGNLFSLGTLDVGGSLSSTGLYVVGTTIFTGAGTIPGSVSYNNLQVAGVRTFDSGGFMQGSLAVTAGSLTLGGNTIVSAVGATVTGSGVELDLNGNSLSVSGNFTTSAGALLRMQNVADVLSVSGDVTFGGGITTGLISAGTLSVGGDFTSSGTDTFVATGTHVTQLNGGAQQIIDLGFSTLSAGSRFNDLQLATSGAQVILASQVAVTGDLTATVNAPPITGVGQTLLVGGDVTASGPVTLTTLQLGGVLTITGTYIVGTTTFAGTNQAIPVLGYSNVQVGVAASPAASASFTGPMIISGDLTLTGTATSSLNVNGQTVTVSGNLTTSVGGVLIMQNAADQLSVFNATFSGAGTNGLLTAGTLIVNGSFSQTLGSTAAFAATGTHNTVFSGPGVQSVQFDNPGAAAGTSGFNTLQLTSSTGSVSLATVVVARGQLASLQTATTTIRGNGNALTVAGVVINTHVFDNVRFTISGGDITDFTNVTFQNYAVSAVQLTVDHPGGGTLNALQNVTFVPLNVGDLGFYIRAIDTDGLPPGLFFAVASTNVVNGPGFTDLAGGADVTWP